MADLALHTVEQLANANIRGCYLVWSPGLRRNSAPKVETSTFHIQGKVDVSLP